MQLLDELRTEHLDLSLSFETLRNVDLSSQESRNDLKLLKSNLLSHLKRENEELYPPLRDAAYNNLKLQNTLDWFTRDLARVTAVLILFLDKYAEGGNQRMFMKEYKRLVRIFNALIKQEENIIFEEYKKVPLDEAA